jgi:hypothetical protein
LKRAVILPGPEQKPSASSKYGRYPLKNRDSTANFIEISSAFILLPYRPTMNQKEPALINSQREVTARAHYISIDCDDNPGLLVHGEDFSRTDLIHGNTFETLFNTMTARLAVALTVGICGIFAVSPCASAHDGKLDVYGCHYNEEGKDYHCHEGTFKGARFDSKIEMIQQLKLQFRNLGQPWPHDDIAEEDITSAEAKPTK